MIFWRAGMSRFGFESGSLPRMALRLRCGGFSRFFRGCFFDAVFANLKTISSNSLFFRVLFFSAFSSGLGSTQPCTCVFELLALNPFLFWV